MSNSSVFRWKEVLRSTTHGSHTQIQLLVQHMPEVAKVCHMLQLLSIHCDAGLCNVNTIALFVLKGISFAMLYLLKGCLLFFF